MIDRFQALSIARKLEEISNLLEPELGKVPKRYRYGNSESLLQLHGQAVYNQIPLSRVKEYAATHGWKLHSVKNEVGAWEWNTPADDGMPMRTPLPDVPGFSDYGRSIQHFVELTAALEKRSQWTILVEMLTF